MNLETQVNSDLWNTVRRSYESQAWSNAILDAIHHFSDAVRAKSGLMSDGTSLAGQAFGGKDPKIKLNRLATESEKNVQAGVEQLVRGLYQAIRNPRSHGRIEDTQKDCDSLIIFVDYLLGVIGHAKASFSIENLLPRINDENFVANKRYSDLILEDIPKNKRLDTLIAIFELRDIKSSSKHKQFFQACIAAVEDTEHDQFFEVVSAHLRYSNDEDELRSVFQILEPKQWSLVAEADRMRSENRVIRSVEAGRYLRSKNKCLGGGLATWVLSYFSSFTLKRDLLSAIESALTSNSVERQDYIFKYLFSSLDKLADIPSSLLTRHIRRKLEEGDSRYKDAIECFEIFGDEVWITPFKSELAAFQAKDNAFLSEFMDDEIPF